MDLLGAWWFAARWPGQSRFAWRLPTAQCLRRAGRRRTCWKLRLPLSMQASTARAHRAGFARALSGSSGSSGDRPRCCAQSAGRRRTGRQPCRHGLSSPGRSLWSACLPTRTSPARWRRWPARWITWLLADLDVPRGASAAVLAAVVTVPACPVASSVCLTAASLRAFCKLAGKMIESSFLDRSTRSRPSCTACRTVAD
jgi:hypothetical protein